MGFGKRDRRGDRVEETIGQEVKGFGDSLDKEEERSAVCLKDTGDNKVPSCDREAEQVMPALE